MNSQIGLSPAIAAPTAIPAKPISVIGVSMTRLSPYFFHRPRETYRKQENRPIKILNEFEIFLIYSNILREVNRRHTKLFLISPVIIN